MSIDEIEDKIHSFKRVETRNKKQQAVLNFVLADQMVTRISKMLDSKNEIELMQLWDYFPALFENERIEYELQKEIDEFENFKSTRKAFALRHNQKMKGG